MEGGTDRASCAIVEKMGEAFADSSEMESLRVREVIKRHFDLHGILQIQARVVLRYTLFTDTACVSITIFFSNSLQRGKW